MTHKTVDPPERDSRTGRYRTTCACGWVSDWQDDWTRASGQAIQHELEANRLRTRNSIQEGVDEAADQGQTSDTQHNTR